MITRVLKYVANTNTMHKLENWAVRETPLKSDPTKMVTNYSKLQKIYPSIFMLFTIGAQTAVIYNSKDMPKKRRIPLVLNNIITCALSIIGGLLMSKPTTKFVDLMIRRANVLYEHNPNKSFLVNGIKTAIPFLIPALTYKFLGPVIATPLADKANNLLVKKRLVDYSKNN